MFLHDLSFVLSFLAGGTQLIGYAVYNAQSKDKISTGSWLIWAIGGGIELASYLAVTHGDMIKNILPAACSVAAISTFAYSLIKKKFEWPHKEDFAFVGIDLGITGIWYFTTAVIANILLQVSAVASFVPMLRQLLRDRAHEKPLAWLIWSLAYGLFGVSILLRMGRIEELAYPATHLVLHLTVACIALYKQRPSR